MAFIDELEKQTIIKKTVKWADKKQNNFSIYNVAFFSKKKKKKKEKKKKQDIEQTY